MKQQIFYTTHAKGGAGASLFATNFAYALAKKFPNKKVLFLDANQLSDTANLFGIKPKKNIFNLGMFLNEEKKSKPNKKTLQKIFAQTTYQINELDVLLSPEEYTDLNELNILYKKTLPAALKIYDYIIIDSDRDNGELLQNTLSNLQSLFIVTTTDNPAVTKTTNFLNILKEEATLVEKIKIVYNQVNKFSKKDLENIFEFPIITTLPTEVNGAWDNILLGVPIIENKKLFYSKEIDKLINTTIKKD
jgi:cellulose biosynthesis protein BcsQ